jgi:polysaccharide biosynthesis protein PelE
MIALVIAVLVLLAIGCEVTALRYLIDAAQGTESVIAFLVLHAIASALFAVVARVALVPRAMHRPAWSVLGYAASLSFFIPLFGMLAMVAIMLAVLISPRALITRPFVAVRHPEFTAPRRDAAARMRVTGLRTVLLDETLAPELRLRSLMLLQNFPIRRAGPFLRRLLSDPADDIRLTAYSLLERETRRISEIIEQDALALAMTTEPAMRLIIHRRLAEQHWELVYTGLAQTDLADYSLAEALRHLDQALAIAPREPGLWLLRGRLLSTRGDGETAGLAYREAIRCGLPTERAAPWLAELAYQQRNHDEVRAQMQKVDVATVGPTVSPVALFWRARNKSTRIRDQQ